MAAQNHVHGSEQMDPRVSGSGIYADAGYDALFANVEPYGHASAAWSIAPNNSGASLVDPSIQSWQTTTMTQPNPYHPHSHQPPPSSTQNLFTAGTFTQTPSQASYASYAQHGYHHAPPVDPTFHQSQPTSLRQSYQTMAHQPRQPQQQPQPQQQQQQQQQHQQQQQIQPPKSVTPQTLSQNGTPTLVHRLPAPAFQGPRPSVEQMVLAKANPVVTTSVQKNPTYTLPKSTLAGNFRVIDTNALVKATNSKPISKHVTIGTHVLQLPLNRTAIPEYKPRLSLNDLKKRAPGDKKLLARFTKKSPSVKTKVFVGAKGPLTTAASGSPRMDSSTDFSSSEYDSDYSSEDDKPVETSPLPAARPDEPVQVVRYDVIKSLWAPRKHKVSTDEIKEALKQFWEVIKIIQERWRTDTKAVTDAENANKTSELPLLNSRVKSQRDLLEVALKTALEHGHPDILHNLGQVRSFLYSLYLFLANRLRANDPDGSLNSLIFETLVRCSSTLTSEALEATKLNKALGLAQKRVTDDKHKAIIQTILDSVAAGSKKAKSDSPAAQGKPVDVKDNKRKAESTSEPAKKPKVAAAVPSPLKKTVPPPTASKHLLVNTSAGQKRPGEKTAPVQTKPRINQVVNKPSSLFASLNAAGKKAPVTAPAKPAVQEKQAAPVKKAAPVAPKPSMGFADVMSSIMNAKKDPVEKPKPEKELPPETPEEKAKRLRKESRRHLRVSFKPDAQLVSIKLFHHDPEEEVGHDASLVRDAGDIKGEGRMFKQHKDLEIDDDEDEPEHLSRPWRDLSMIDFSFLDEEMRDRNYEPYGGGKKQPVCPEKETNLQREKSVLMVVYSDPTGADIPPSPKEPLEAPPEKEPQVKDFGAPNAANLSRASDLLINKPIETPAGNQWSALESIFAKFSNQNTSQNAAAPPQSSSSSSYQASYPETAPAMSAPAPAAPMITPTAAAAPTTDLASILSALQQAVPQVQQAPALQPAPTPTPAPAVDLSSILATLRTAATPTSVPPAAPPTSTAYANATAYGYADPNAAAWAAYYAQLAQQQAQQVQQQAPQPPAPSHQAVQHSAHNHYSNEAGKRQWRGGDGGGHGHERDRGGSFKKHKHNSAGGGSGEPYVPPYKVALCKYYAQGKCIKGEACTFIHDEKDL